MKEITIVVLGGGFLILILILFAPHDEMENSTNMKDVNFAVSPESFEANVSRTSGVDLLVVVENEHPFETSIDLENCKFEKQQLEFNTRAQKGTNYVLKCRVPRDAPLNICISELGGYDSIDCETNPCPEGFECLPTTFRGFLRFFQVGEEIKKLPIILTVN